MLERSKFLIQPRGCETLSLRDAPELQNKKAHIWEKESGTCPTKNKKLQVEIVSQAGMSTVCRGAQSGNFHVKGWGGDHHASSQPCLCPPSVSPSKCTVTHLDTMEVSHSATNACPIKGQAGVHHIHLLHKAYKMLE